MRDRAGGRDPRRRKMRKPILVMTAGVAVVALAFAEDWLQWGPERATHGAHVCGWAEAGTRNTRGARLRLGRSRHTSWPT
ncbi:exported hypothetical protein [Candidatus Sulfopaludibacter sp. SbA4]|nr:exported hypothetical protein [Candidatus Sulfopaludibacter sp. SbA4]